ncbi:MAG TPA: class I SAM-dependent methyltransferase [candidate division WOR-3 bacterium]|uniref:Class I SAM-dependent methyltransferase n=1 Tax=candidate division WOR-3 bacterium TaxID=2052148 RepID=A0A7V0XFB7_UNCW3|nr:class I SAM-dependent methyltransferase [candidate division WOR-3 bacterium]
MKIDSWPSKVAHRLRGTAYCLITLNRRACTGLSDHLPHARFNINEAYRREVARRLGMLNPDAVVADVGGGRSCCFARHRPPGVWLVAIDVSAEELALNRDVDETRVGDCSRHLPMADGEADMLVSHSAIEHFDDVSGFVAEARRVLKPGGWFINTFPCRFAPFALINQLLPPQLSRFVLRSVFPGSEGVLGYRAFYDRCYPSGFFPLLRRNSLMVEGVMVSYSQSGYFDFFLPLYVASLGYELIVWCADARELAAYLLVSARRVGR